VSGHTIRIARDLSTLIRSLIKSLVSATPQQLAIMAVVSLESMRLGVQWLECRAAADWPNQPLINRGIERTEDRRASSLAWLSSLICRHRPTSIAVQVTRWQRLYRLRHKTIKHKCEKSTNCNHFCRTLLHVCYFRIMTWAVRLSSVCLSSVCNVVVP